MMDALDRIALEASMDESEAQAQEDAILNPPPATPPAHVWAQIPFGIGALVSQLAPELRDVFTESACIKWGEAMAQVSEKYGWEAGDTIAKWAPECALVMATLPLAIPTYQIIKAKKAEKAAADKKPEKPEPEKLAPMPSDFPEIGGLSDSDK